jgi:hypothetical protein
MPRLPARAEKDFATACVQTRDEGRVHSRWHHEAEETQFGRAQGRQGQVEQRKGSYCVYSR